MINKAIIPSLADRWHNSESETKLLDEVAKGRKLVETYLITTALKVTTAETIDPHAKIL